MIYVGLLVFFVSNILWVCLVPWYWKLTERLAHKLPDSNWILALFLLFRFAIPAVCVGFVIGLNVIYFGHLNVRLWGDLWLFHVVLIAGVFTGIWLAKRISHRLNVHTKRSK